MFWYDQWNGIKPGNPGGPNLSSAKVSWPAPNGWAPPNESDDCVWAGYYSGKWFWTCDGFTVMTGTSLTFLLRSVGAVVREERRIAADAVWQKVGV